MGPIKSCDMSGMLANDDKGWLLKINLSLNLETVQKMVQLVISGFILQCQSLLN